MTEYTDGHTDNSWMYPPGYTVPDEFWRKIELVYPDKRVATLIWRTEPPVGELPRTMINLQEAATRNGYRILVTLENGKMIEAPPL